MFYVLLFWMSLKDGERAREKARGDTNCLSWIPSKQQQNKNKKKKKKTGTSGCGSFVVAYFQPTTSIDRLHMHATKSVGVLVKFSKLVFKGKGLRQRGPLRVWFQNGPYRSEVSVRSRYRCDSRGQCVQANANAVATVCQCTQCVLKCMVLWFSGKRQ